MRMTEIEKGVTGSRNGRIVRKVIRTLATISTSSRKAVGSATNAAGRVRGLAFAN